MRSCRQPGAARGNPPKGKAGVRSFPARCLLLLRLRRSVGLQIFQRSQGGYRGLLGVGHRAGHDGGGPRQLFAVFQQVTPSLGAGQGPVHRAVSVPSARVTLTDDGVAGGLAAGGAYGPAGGELRQPLQPASLPARTPMM